MHEARCIHGDRLGAWYDTHVAKWLGLMQMSRRHMKHPAVNMFSRILKGARV